MARWIRLDVGWDSSEWVMELEAEGQLAWVKLLCWVKVHGMGGRVKALAPGVAARKWDIPATAVELMLRSAERNAALEIDGSEWVVTKWDDYQESDPTASERMRRWRASRDVTAGHGSHTVTPVTRAVTRRVTETGTETDTPKEKPLTGAKRKTPKTSLPDGWEPNETHTRIAAEEGRSLARETEGFRDSALAHARRYADWDRAFSSWLRNESYRPAKPAVNGYSPPPLTESQRAAYRARREKYEAGGMSAERAAEKAMHEVRAT